ncbi:MerR family transcriptional regulator [Vagococcus carniphilus]|uniref:MerR family transcriptional regulator n=1 Tax=Vagococcus carniphilus TaxID=218144 RepID=A0AAW8U548_9ENTE|nr:MerR family transcriptional regulator [Vagococcus carniphilus]MDT2831325.1 MerR family transcriptional regulator [Vagococcus carniphilus]MDT2832902.1 MerR family transcriptional regulator [Vagococcus carniphilus]MDT2840340.1 MerR family transcriptional regulator [Vagococcus carniphilus]MDT2854846.1 MerR family transcriptional regulator [Vagococcus carniphilus]MDT2865388.1 MerR family transcriptional regulator [Vagococcus carniphilus]
MKINHFSKLSNTSVRMLRHYEKIGLLKISRSLENNNYRDYSAKDLQRVAQIKILQELGFSLSIIKEILEKEDISDLDPYFSMQKEYLEEQLKKTEHQQALLHTLSDILVDDQRYLDYHVTLKELPERQVMSLRKTIPNYEQEQMLWNELYQEFLVQNVQFATPPLGLSIYHDEAYEEDKIDLEIQSSIVGNYTDTEAVHFKIAPKQTIVSTTFHGDFNQMPIVMEALGQWIEANDLVISGPMINIFHVSYAQDKNPDNWITESCLVVSTKEEINNG